MNDDELARLLGWHPWEVEPCEWLYQLWEQADEARAYIELMVWDAQRDLNELEACLFKSFFAERTQLLLPPYGIRRNADASNHSPLSRYY